MNQPNRESELADFYRAQNLPDHQLDTMLTTADLARDARRWRVRAIAAAIAFLAATVFGVWQLQKPQPGTQVTEQRPLDEQGIGTDDTPDLAHADAQPATESRRQPRYRFVAVRSHGDGCPHCRATGELFARFGRDYDDRPVEFEQIDLRNPTRTASLQRAVELKLTKLVANQPETAFAVILSPTGQQLAQLDPTNEASLNQQQFLNIVDQ